MRSIFKLLPILSLAAISTLTLLVGCSGNSASAPVSGIVTIDGKPVEGLRVSFFPKPATGNNSPGPYSTGVTDADGRYVLTNRYGKDGAMVWQHMVTFEYDDVDVEAVSKYKAAVADAQAAGVELSAEDKALAARAIEHRNKHPQIPPRYLEGSGQFVIDVPAGGTDSANMDMVNE